MFLEYLQKTKKVDTPPYKAIRSFPHAPQAKERYGPLISFIELLTGKELGESERIIITILADAGISTVWIRGNGTVEE